MSKKIYQFFTPTLKRKFEDEAGGTAKKIKIEAVDIEEEFKTIENYKAVKKESDATHEVKQEPETVYEGIPITKHVRLIRRRKARYSEYQCDLCAKSFTKISYLRQHIRSHLPSKRCNICHEEIKLSSMFRHKTTQHGEERKYDCSICTKSFKSLQNRSKHEKVHDKKFECKFCGNKFPTKADLNAHQRDFHEKSRGYSCEICDKSFSQKGCLTRHQKIHDKSSEKEFKCEKCSFSTDRKDTMKKHQKCHEREEAKFVNVKSAVKCKICGKISRNKKLLREHISQVHQTIPVQCDLCGIQLKVKASLPKHFMRHLSKKTANV